MNDDVNRRARAVITVGYQEWLRYGDRAARLRASQVAWVLAGGDYRIPMLNRAAARAAQDRSAGSRENANSITEVAGGN